MVEVSQAGRAGKSGGWRSSTPCRDLVAASGLVSAGVASVRENSTKAKVGHTTPMAIAPERASAKGAAPFAEGRAARPTRNSNRKEVISAGPRQILAQAGARAAPYRSPRSKADVLDRPRGVHRVA